MQVISEYYRRKGAEGGPDKLIEFKSEKVTLDIQKDGITTKDNTWKLFPLTYPPEVSYSVNACDDVMIIIYYNCTADC